MAPFPADYSTLVDNGVRELRELAAALRAELTRGVPEPGPLWLAVRDREGLADRLAGIEDFDWRMGWADDRFSGQDVGLLRDLAATPEPSPYYKTGQEDRWT